MSNSEFPETSGIEVMNCTTRPREQTFIAPIAQSVSALDFNFERAVEGSILTVGKRLSLKI